MHAPIHQRVTLRERLQGIVSQFTFGALSLGGHSVWITMMNQFGRKYYQS
ncbi:MAG: hypothetical protein ACFCU1_13435 [Sumerlaeia bacterium]